MTYDTANRKIYAIDVDGTLTNGECYWNGEEITPNQKIIDWVNKKYKEGHIIIIHTARPYDEIRKTIAWLIEHGVMYHGINMDKMGANYYIDDRFKHPEDLK